MNLRSVLHLDVDAFFAAVEQRDDPRLRGRPVAVGTGVVASCSYESRRWGVRTGMRLSEARRLCRPLLVLPGDYRRYEQAGRRILAICRELTPLVEVAALDDLYLELPPPHEPDRTAGMIHAQVRDEVGLSVSLGLGVNKLIARVATREAKQRKLASADGASVTVGVPAGTERAYLEPWPMRVLVGAGPKLAARLDRLNVRRVGEVAAMPLAVLCGLFGARGKVLRDQAHGIDPRPVQPHRPALSVSRSTSFDPPAADHAFLQAMLDHLLERACSWLRLRGLATRGLTLTLRYGDHASVDGRLTLRTATDQEEELKGLARERFGRLYQRRLPLRLLGVELTPLGPPPAQPSLFPDAEQEQRRRLSACKDEIRQRFGFMSVMSGSALLLAGKLEHDRENFRLRTPCLTR
jgi:DNA polymerase-4